MKKYTSNLLIGFGISLLVLFISSTASFISINNLLTSVHWVNHSNEIIIDAEEILAALREAEAGQRGYLMTGDPEYLEFFNYSQSSAREALDLIDDLTIDNPVQQESAQELRAHIENRLVLLNQLITHKDTTGIIDTEGLNKGKELMDKVEQTLSVIKQRETELLANRVTTMNNSARYTTALIVIAALIALFITTLFYVRIKNDFAQRALLQKELERKDRDISERIDIIKSVADRIALGNYTIRIDHQQSDSLGNVAVSLNKMAASLEQSFQILSDKEWAQSGMASLNDVMIGEHNVEKLCDGIIEFIASFIGAHAGAVYILDHEELRFFAGFAYAADPARASFKLGEGVIGQAVATNRLMELKDIPPESIYIKFTLGEATPNHLLAIPIMDGHTIKGAIELASLGNFSEREIDFLKNAVHNIGIAISAAQNRRRLQELLDETQSQAEELQAQHTELENINSELEVQAEKLQASEEELRAQQDELHFANQALEERSLLLEERNQVISARNIEIQEKADALAQSMRYKSEFLANMSHELRTPLNSILLLSRLMSENNNHNLTNDQIEYARVIETSGQGLLTLIDEILDLSKIESGKMELEYQLVPIAEIADDIKSLFTPVALAKNLEFKIQISPDLPESIETDKLRLEQILRNLVSNALKFTAKGYVSLTAVPVAQDNRLIDIVVKDTGIGIPTDKQELVFEAFQQADGSTQRKYGGTGLGLSISRELVKLLGGEIRLTSEVNAGSEFTVRVPLRKHNIPAPQPAPVATPEVNPIEESRKKFISTDVPRSIPDDREHVGRTDKVILIVEDDVNFAKALLEYTREKGYKGIVAVRGDEGLELAKEFLPLGILLDIQLPVKDGWEVMEELKANPSTRHIPVHIMSVHQFKNESLLKGAVDFIDKPIAFEKMHSVFQKIEYVLTHHPKKVLIVEENTKHANALAYFLQKFDVRLEVKSGVDDAVTSLRQQDVDCVVLDMCVPHERSYETLEEVKRTPGLENLPIIVFTGKSLSSTEEVKLKRYADSIVVKTAHSFRRILDEVSLFLHLMEKKESDNSPRKSKQHTLTLDDILENKTVLLVDDDVRNIFSLTKVMESIKMNVVTAIDGKDALKQLTENPQVDIVLMDMMMPEMDGYETTKAIRTNPAYSELPIIAVTAKAMVGDRDKCIQAGASDYITKPVDIDQLLSLLRVWLYEKN